MRFQSLRKVANAPVSAQSAAAVAFIDQPQSATAREVSHSITPTTQS